MSGSPNNNIPWHQRRERRLGSILSTLLLASVAFENQSIVWYLHPALKMSSRDLRRTVLDGKVFVLLS